MITIFVHTQKLMSGRVDYICPNCKEKSCYYPATVVPPVRCPDCKLLLPDTMELQKNEMMRLHWHFYKGQGQGARE